MTCTEVQTDRASPGSPGQRDDNGKMIELGAFILPMLLELRKQLMIVTTSHTSFDSEVDLLKSKINDTERERRDQAGVVDL